VPCAYLALGSLLGTALLLATAGLVATTKGWLIAGHAAHPRAKSYAALSAAALGRRAALATQAAVVAFCFGFLVVDLVGGGERRRLRGRAGGRSSRRRGAAARGAARRWPARPRSASRPPPARQPPGRGR
jgi:hypothetical protein